MEIRKVQVQDIPQIKSIADSLVVTPETKEKDLGFYDYCLSREQYQRRMNDFFLIGCRNSEIEGFCMAYDSEFIRRLVEQEPELQEDTIFKYLTSQQEDYVYIDQLAVRNPKTFSGSVCACGLVDRVKEMSRGKDSLIGVVPHFPWKNETAIRFHKHQGTELVDEIGQKDKIVFGVYRMSLV